MGGPNNTAGGAAGAATNAFANTFGRFLLAKANNDEQAKRQQKDDERQLQMLGFQALISQNPGKLQDQAFVQNFFKGMGTKAEPSQIQMLGQLGGVLQQGLDQKQALAAQQNAEFNALLTGGEPAPQTAPTTPTQPAPPQILSAQPQVAPVQLPQFTPGAQSPHKALTGPPFDEVIDTPQVAAPAMTLPEPPPVDPQTISHMRQLSRLAPGRNLTVRSPDKLRTITIDRDEGLKQIANSMIANGTRPFDVFRTFQREVGGAGLPDDVRAAAGIDGLTMLLEPELKKVAEDSTAKVNLAGALQTLQQQGLFVTPKEQETVLQPIAQRIYAGNLQRIEEERQRALQYAEQLKPKNPEEAQIILDRIIANRRSVALEDTARQMSGLGLTPEQRTALFDHPTTEEALMDLATSQVGATTGEQLEAILDVEKKKANIQADAAATRSTRVAEAEQAFSLQQTQPVLEELTASVMPILQESLLGRLGKYVTPFNDLSRYASLRDALQTRLAKGILGETGVVDVQAGLNAAKLLPPTEKVAFAPAEALKDLQAFNRVLKEQSGGKVFLKDIPEAERPSTHSPFLDTWGPK